MSPKRKLEEISKRAQHRVLDFNHHISEDPANDFPTSPFFQLPREIRDLCYHEIWRTTLPFTIIYMNHEFRVEYEISSTHEFRVALPGFKHTPDPETPAPWFLANKQILHEAIEQFQRGSSWAFLGGQHHRTSLRPLISPWKPPGLQSSSTEQASLQDNHHDVASRMEL